MKQIETTVTCDIDHHTPASEIRFAFKGKAYKVDLCDACKADFNRFWQAGELVKEPMRERRKVK